MADRAGMIRWFLEELPGLRESGIINSDTEENLKGYYLARLAAAPSPQKYFLLALSIIGGLLITAGTVLIFNYNWDILGKNLQIAVSFLPLAAAFCLSVFTLAGRRGQAWRECSALATAAGASIAVALLSHIYHTGGDFREFMMLILLFSVPLIYLFNSISLTAVYSIMLFSQLSWRATDQTMCLILLGAVLPMILYHLLKENSPYRKAMRYIAVACVLFGLFVFSKEGPLPLFTATSLFFLCGIRVYERKENMWGNPWLILSFVTLTVLLGIGSSGAWSCISFPAVKIVTIYGLFEGLLLAAFAGVFAYDAVKKRITAERILLVAVIPAALFPETTVFQVMMNILLALFGFILLRNGWIHRRMLPFNGGFIMIATLLGCRFFDSGLGVLPRAGLFILLGIGFIVSNIILSRRIRKEVSHV